MSKRTKKVGISGKVCEINPSPLSLATYADPRVVRHKVCGLDDISFLPGFLLRLDDRLPTPPLNLAPPNTLLWPTPSWTEAN